MLTIKTNLNIDKMFDELKQHYKNITNKEYIKNSIETHYKYKLITQAEKTKLTKQFSMGD